MQNTAQALEFYKIKEQIKEYAKTELGREYIDQLSFSNSKEEVKHLLDELKEMIDLISRYSSLPIQTSVSIIHLIDIAKKTALLTPQDLNFISNDIDTSVKLLASINKVVDEFPLIGELTSNFADLSSLNKEIKRVITPSLTVSDNASSELKEIRSKIKQLEAKLNSKISGIALQYSSYLSDVNLTIREGHFVLPVKTGFKNKILGIVYDVSDSGNTTFIEPLEIVQINNDIATKKIEENEEVRKILKSLTALVLLQEEEVVRNNQIIAKLDFLSSKALFALANDMVVSSISEKQEIELLSARHPLISKEKVIANDYYLPSDKPMVIISGPNAGGKTVSIKTVGLLAFMNQCGLALTAKQAKLGIFKNIFLDIGDNQSLSDNLSTFSAHMSNISSILDVVGGNDLVLLDELGTGTDPKEGELIALGIVKELEAKHPLALISSHYSKIKEYAFMSEKIENSCMLFDEEKLVPTYKYKYSVPGKSYGLEVASRYGISDKIIANAKKEMLEQDDNRFENLLEELQSKIEKTEKLSEELSKSRENLAKEQKALESTKESLKHQKEHLLEEVKLEKEEIISETKQEIEEIIKLLSKDELKLHEAVELKKRVESLQDEIETISYNEEINVDDYVSVPSLNIEGRVNRIKGNNAFIRSSDGFDIKVEKSRLHKIEEPKSTSVKSKTSNYEDKIKTDVGLELNIIGLRRDEALDVLKKYIDACIVKNIKQVRIIHGFGSGTLRKMTHEYLNTLKGVKYRLGDIHEGGSGATVVTLHD